MSNWLKAASISEPISAARGVPLWSPIHELPGKMFGQMLLQYSIKSIQHCKIDGSYSLIVEATQPSPKNNELV